MLLSTRFALLPLALASMCGSAAALDANSATGQLDTFMRLRGTSDGRDTFANWWVTIYAVLPGERPREIMKMDGYNVGRFVKAEDGSVQLISREVSYYKDLKTGEILKEWVNPFTNEKNTVLHVANDPVNARFPAPKAGDPGRFPFMVNGDDVILRMDVPLAYPNPLPPTEFPAESAGAMYTGSEHFTFFGKTKDLDDAKSTSAPATWAWARTGPWLPWMKMGSRPGYVLYSGHGKKFLKFDELPADVREFTKANFPQYQSSPATFVTPNETSWTYYKKQAAVKK